MVSHWSLVTATDDITLEGTEDMNGHQDHPDLRSAHASHLHVQVPSSSPYSAAVWHLGVEVGSPRSQLCPTLRDLCPAPQQLTILILHRSDRDCRSLHQSLSPDCDQTCILHFHYAQNAESYKIKTMIHIFSVKL